MSEPKKMPATSVSTETIRIERAYRNGFYNGMEEGADIVEKYHEARDSLQLCEMKIEVAAMCDNGPETRKMLKYALEDLQDILPKYHRRLRELHDEPLLQIDPDSVARWDTYYSDLTDHINQYLNSETGADQLNLQRFISRNNPAVAEFRKQTGVKTRRGRPPIKVRLFIGRYAAQCEEPGTREFWWMIGKKLYDLLKAKQPPPKTCQHETFEELQKYMNIDGTGVPKDQRTDLSTLVWRARNNRLARQRELLLKKLKKQ